MRGKVLVAALASAAISGTAAADAAAQATATVNAGPGLQWTPNIVPIYTNGTVTFANPTMTGHNLVVAGAELAPDSTGWTRTYTAPATPTTVMFACTVHPGMNGQLNVTAAPTTPAPPTAPPPPSAPTPTNPTVDTKAPIASRVRTSVTLRRAIVRLRLDEAAEVTARLRRRGSRRTLKRVTRELDAGNGQLTLRRTLRAGARYTVALRIEDAAGNITNRTVSFRAPRS